MLDEERTSRDGYATSRRSDRGFGRRRTCDSTRLCVCRLRRGPCRTGNAGLEAAAKEVESAGVRALVICADVSEFKEIDDAATLVENELGPIDVWVNNAMTTVFAPTQDIDPDDFRRAIEVTFLGQVWGTMAALTRMRPQNRETWSM